MLNRKDRLRFQLWGFFANPIILLLISLTLGVSLGLLTVKLTGSSFKDFSSTSIKCVN